MLRVDFTFDKKIIEKNGYTMSNIYETIKWNLVKKYFMCGRRGSPFFRRWRKEKRFF